MKNLLRVFLLFIIALSGYGQATPVTVTNGVIALKGKGKLGGNKDGYQYYQYNTPVTGSFYLQAYFKSLTNSSQSYTGLAFRNIATYQKTDGGVAAVMLVYQNDSLKCLIKSAYNQKATAFLVSGNIKIPGHLKLVKEGNDAKFYYSNQTENDVTINFILLGSVQNAFLGWTNITQNFITGGNNGVVQTALVSKRAFGSLSTPVPDGDGTTVVSGIIFPNMFQTITPETVNDTFGAEKFMTLTYPSGLARGTFPKTYNSDLGFNLPNWINILHTDMSLIYKNKGYDVIDNFGYLGSTDIRKHGVQGVHWQLFPWGNFVTALPTERRVETYLGTLVHDFLALDDAGVIQKGFEIANNTDFGNIVVGGKTQRVYTSVDSEGAGEDGSAGIRKPLLLFKTIFENTIGIVSYMYGTPIQSDLGYNTNGNGYADANGDVPSSMINPLFRDTENFNGVPYKLINSRGLAPHGEISHYGESAYGNYNDGVRQLTVFGASANNEHYLARVVEHNEKNYYAYKKLGGADLVMFQNKSICDRGSTGWKYADGNCQNGGTKASFTGYLKRDQVFKSQMASFFSGVHTVEWNRPPLGVNSDSQNGIEEARTILNTEVIFSQTERVSALKLRTGAFEFSLYNAEYKLEGETNFRKERGYELKDSQDNLLVRFMKKGNYMIVFVADPYNLATKKNLTVRWGTFEKTFTSADWASCYSDGSTKDYIYAIYKLPTPGTETTVVTPPTITKNIANPTANQSVILTSSGCQSASYVTKWYDSAEGNLLATSLTYTVNAVHGNGYYAKCVGTSTSSAASNYIVFNISTVPPSGVTITEPNKPQYFFSNLQAPSYYDNLNNLPAIFQTANNYDLVNDLVWLKNDKIKIGINLKRGGQLAWASLIDATTNLIYNGYDGGFQVQMDAYQKKDGYQQNGKYSRARYSDSGQYSSDPNFADNNGIIPFTSYNVTQGGDFRGYSQSVIDYHTVGTNGYYVKIRPIYYTMDREFSRTFIEVTYYLEDYALKCDYKYTSYRNDGQYDGSGFDGGHAPVCFLVNNLSKYQSYVGNSPWSRDSVGIEDGNLPNESSGQTPLTKNSKERWSLVYNPATNATIGVYANTTETENSFALKQKEVYNNDRQGGEFGGGYTILGRNYDLVPFLSTFDRTNFSKNISSYLIVAPDPATFIDVVYDKSGH
jgi:hypothetical protein